MTEVPLSLKFNKAKGQGQNGKKGEISFTNKNLDLVIHAQIETRISFFFLPLASPSSPETPSSQR